MSGWARCGRWRCAPIGGGVPDNPAIAGSAPLQPASGSSSTISTASLPAIATLVLREDVSRWAEHTPATGRNRLMVVPHAHLTVRRDVTSALFGKAVNHTQTRPLPLPPPSLCRTARKPEQGFARHTGSGSQTRSAARSGQRATRPVINTIRFEDHLTGLNTQSAASGHCVAGVDGELGPSQLPLSAVPVAAQGLLRRFRCSVQRSVPAKSRNAESSSGTRIGAGNSVWRREKASNFPVSSAPRPGRSVR